MKPNWSQSPPWATHWLELEGNRELWSDKERTEVRVTLVDPSELVVVPEIEDAKNFYRLRVLQCIPRPQWKTLIHFKDNGKLVTYEAEGHLSHSAVKRQLMDEMGVDASIRVMLEYIEIV